MQSLNDRISQWKSKGHFEKFRDHEVFCMYLEGLTGASASPLHVIFHGYPTCSYDWKEVLKLLPEHNFLLVDFLGFGLSDKPPDHQYSLCWQADLMEEMIIRHNSKVPMRRVILIGHDMGTSVVSEVLARHTESKLNQKIDIQGVVLFNGSMFMERANLILGQKVLRSSLGPLLAKLTFSLPFRWQLGKVFSREHPMSHEEGEDQWILMSWNNGHKINDKLIKYTFERVEKADRWLGAVKDWKGPMAYIWGKQDPVCGQWQLDGWKELRPNTPVEMLPSLAHYPQIEDPKFFSDALIKSLDYIVNYKP